MAITKELLQFRAGDPDEIVERMRAMNARGDGKEWLNLQPWVDEESRPKLSLLRHIFSGRGTPIPTCTWVPGHPGATPPNIAQMGIQHGAGADALGTIRDGGIPMPEGWVPIQDHTKRGVVIEVPREAEVRDVLMFLIGASSVLAGDMELDDRWIAGFVTQE